MRWRGEIPTCDRSGLEAFRCLPVPSLEVEYHLLACGGWMDGRMGRWTPQLSRRQVGGHRSFT